MSLEQEMTAMVFRDFMPLLIAYAWPLVVLILTAVFYRQIRERLSSIEEAKFGSVSVRVGKADLDRKGIEPETPKGAPAHPESFDTKKTGSLYWLGSDLAWTAQMSLRGAPKHDLARGIERSLEHLQELELAESDAAQKLQNMYADLRGKPETRLDRAWRNMFASEVGDVAGYIGRLAVEKQPGFKA